jgi:hypothetical protein
MPPVPFLCGRARDSSNYTAERWRHQAFGCFSLPSSFVVSCVGFLMTGALQFLFLFFKHFSFFFRSHIAGCMRLTSFFSSFLSFLVVVFFYDFSSSLAHIEKHGLILEAEIVLLLLASYRTHRP